MPNERTTEDIVRSHFKKHGLSGQIFEEQNSDDPKIKKALAKASKSGGGAGKPEFLVRLKDDPDFLIVVECKADLSKHMSAKRDKPDQYAVDGVLLYCAHLSKNFDVIGPAISGTSTTAIRISTFRQLREAPTAEILKDEHGAVERLLATEEYQRLLKFDPAVRRRSQEELMQLPTSLFHPIGVVTCGLMFEAHQPHADSPSPTWFGSWKNDGFIKQKNRGRIDPNGQWPQIRDAWLKSFHARATVSSQSIARHVDANDEWCAEAYLETDYSKIQREDFERVVRNYAVFKLLGAVSTGEKTEADDRD